MKKWLWISGLLVSLAGLNGLAQAEPVDISAQELRALQGAGKEVLVVDVRTPGEFAAGHVPGAVNLPHDGVTGDETALRDWKGKPVVLYCHSGRRAGLAAAVLEKKGFLQLRHLQGDMPGWERDGLLVAK